MFNKVIILSKHITKKPRRKERGKTLNQLVCGLLKVTDGQGWGWGQVSWKLWSSFHCVLVLRLYWTGSCRQPRHTSCVTSAGCELNRVSYPSESPRDCTPGAADVPDVGVSPNSAGGLRSSQSSRICTVRPVFAFPEPTVLTALQRMRLWMFASSTGASELSSCELCDRSVDPS